MYDVNEPFSKNLKRFRLERGMTQADLAEKLGVSGVSIFGYESGDQLPRREVLNAVCRTFGVRPSALFEDGEDDDKPVPPKIAEMAARNAEMAAQLARACNPGVPPSKKSTARPRG